MKRSLILLLAALIAVTLVMPVSARDGDRGVDDDDTPLFTVIEGVDGDAYLPLSCEAQLEAFHRLFEAYDLWDYVRELAEYRINYCTPYPCNCNKCLEWKCVATHPVTSACISYECVKRKSGCDSCYNDPNCHDL